MALTLNRPDFTATELNTAFTNVRNAVATYLPARILTVAGTSNFVDLDIFDGGNIGGTVFTISDSINALAALANERQAGFFTVAFDPDNSAYVIEVSGYIRSLTLSDINQNIIYKGNGVDDRTLRSRGVTVTSSSFSFNNTKDEDVTQLSLYARVHYFASGGTHMGTSFSVSGGLANAPTNALGCYEIYDNKGYEQWNLGVATTVNMTAFTSILKGYEQWDLGIGTTLGAIEYFDCGWDEGVRPIVEGVVRIEENVTSQIDGSKTLFTTKRPYKKGTLQVMWNGQVQYEGTISEVSSTTFRTTFTATSGDVLIITYEQSNGGIERISLY